MYRLLHISVSTIFAVLLGSPFVDDLTANNSIKVPPLTPALDLRLGLELGSRQSLTFSPMHFYLLFGLFLIQSEVESLEEDGCCFIHRYIGAKHGREL
jgi:hypothetical protein